jgi:butyryl-CoA dehydrogenase/short/branched chain acyl-CoA dehydrogenase
MPALDSLETPPALTALSEDEKLFQTTVRKFAREQIRPYVREMDEAGVFRKDIIKQFFEMGLMGIEIPEEYGGQGGSFFQAILAVEELSAVDPSAGVIVDVQNTICNNGGEHGGVLCTLGGRFGLGRFRNGDACR